jgi:hypothetical protein
VSRWTTNLIVSGMILVLALGLGREIVCWWRVDPAAVAPGVGALDLGSSDPFGPFTLEFGDAPYTIEQQAGRGDRKQAIEQLLAGCRIAAERGHLPTEPPAEAEQRLLESTAALEPLEVYRPQAGTLAGVRFYGPAAGLPLVVGVASIDLPAAPPTAAQSLPAAADSSKAAQKSAPQPAAGSQLGASRDRVLVWGIAAPAGPQAWSLYTFRLSQPSAIPLADMPSVRLPPASARTMSLRDARGETLVGFAGHGATEDWRGFFAADLGRASAVLADKWQLTGGVWHARYVLPAAGPADKGPTTVELQFGPDPDGRLSGLVRIVPQPPPAAAHTPASETEREH